MGGVDSQGGAAILAIGALSSGEAIRIQAIRNDVDRHVDLIVFTDLLGGRVAGGGEGPAGPQGAVPMASTNPGGCQRALP